MSILAEMVYSAIWWEDEHSSDSPLRHYRLTERVSAIHSIPKGKSSARANSESPPEGDTNDPA